MLDIINKLFPQEICCLIYNYAREKNKNDYDYQYYHTSHYIIYNLISHQVCYWIYNIYLEPNQSQYKSIEIIFIDYPPRLFSINLINLDKKLTKYYKIQKKWGIALGHQFKLRYFLKVCKISDMDNDELLRWLFFLNYLINLCKMDWESLFKIDTIC
jgi:hypothetical protein